VKFDSFLLAMAAAVVLAFLAPELGTQGGPLKLELVTRWGIALIFFLHGANLSRQALASGVRNWRLHSAVQSTTFLLFPLIGFVLYFATAALFSAELRLGLFFLCALSSTVSSSVSLTAMARGNLAGAIFNATLSGLIGMLATPLLVGLVMTGTGHPLDLGSAVVDILLTLLAPFAAGQLLRPVLMTILARHKQWVTRLDRTVIVLIIYASFCDSVSAGVWREQGVAQLLTLLALVSLLLLAALAYTHWLGRRLGFSREDAIAAAICGSQKSLANGAPIGKILFAGHPAFGLILLPLILYHQVQLVVCTLLAQRYARQADNPKEPSS
jgi:sodium/bile acid cotransporter 7